MFQYTDSVTLAKTSTVSQGLMGKASVVPSKILVSSSSDQLSVLWIAEIGSLQIRKLIQLSNDKMYFTTSVVIKNIGLNKLKDFYCKSFVFF
jgi:hypothetical protein